MFDVTRAASSQCQFACNTAASLSRPNQIHDQVNAMKVVGLRYTSGGKTARRISRHQAPCAQPLFAWSVLSQVVLGQAVLQSFAKRGEHAEGPTMSSQDQARQYFPLQLSRRPPSLLLYGPMSVCEAEGRRQKQHLPLSPGMLLAYGRQSCICGEIRLTPLWRCSWGLMCSTRSPDDTNIYGKARCRIDNDESVFWLLGDKTNNGGHRICMKDRRATYVPSAVSSSKCVPPSIETKIGQMGERKDAYNMPQHKNDMLLVAAPRASMAEVVSGKQSHVVDTKLALCFIVLYLMRHTAALHCTAAAPEAGNFDTHPAPGI